MSWEDDPVQYSVANGVLTATWGTGGKFAPGTYQYVQGGGGPGYTDPNGFGWVPLGGTAPSASIGNVSAATGINPSDLNYTLYGHTIPLSVFGRGRIGGEIIAGPWVANGQASFCISFGLPADPIGGTRTLKEIAFDSEVVWDSTHGFYTEAFTYRFYPGTLTQAADALEISHFGADAVAYRPQILIWFENLPLAATKFGKIPYVAAVLEDSTGPDVNLGEAFERLAYSPWVGYTSAQFETVGITDGLVNGGLIFTDQAQFLDTIQQFGRFFPKWDILQTDKLRISDRGATVTPDITLDMASLSGSVSVQRSEQNLVPSVLELSTIDPDADYTIVPSRAQSPRAPVAVTTSVSTETAYLPAIIDSSTRIALVNYAKHHEDRARRRIMGTAMMRGLQIEPGDLISAPFPGDDIWRVLETLHGVNYTVGFTAESILNCEVSYGNWDSGNHVYSTLSNNNLTITGTSPGNGGVLMVQSGAKTSGKFYIEIAFTAVGGWIFGGWVGVCENIEAPSTTNDTNTVVLKQNGDYDVNASWTGYSDSHFVSGDVIGIACDLDHRKVWFKKVSGTPGLWNGPINGNPATNTGGWTAPTGSVVPCAGFGINNDVYTANFGASPFVGTVPSGFTAGWPQ